MARSNLRDEFYKIRRDIALQLLTRRGKLDGRIVAMKWLDKHEDEVTIFRNMMDEMKLRDTIDFATLSVAAEELRDLTSG